MRPIATETRRLALFLHDAGLSRAEVCEVLGVSRSSLSRWQQRLEPRTPAQEPCWRCTDPPGWPSDPTAYLYVLGQYLGDGHVAPTGRGTGRTQVLRVYGDDAWPGLQDEVSQAIRNVLPVNVFRTRHKGCTGIEAVSVHWRCLLPQQGPGKKHSRPIELTQWQERLVEQDPRPLIRGLIHSDGCRVLNRVTTRGVAYTYPRYFFVNESQDILNIFSSCLDLLDIPWRYSRPNAISVARKAGVSALDGFVGPKF